MKATIPCLATIAILGLLLFPVELFAQDNVWLDSSGNWTDFNSWDFFELPDPDLDERAVIGSTVEFAAPEAVVEVTDDLRASNPSATVVLGDGFGTNGSLNITPNGALAVATGETSSGNFETGLSSGVGLLNVEGTLEIAGRLSAATDAGDKSTITLSGSAIVTAGSGFLDRNLVIDGANVSASFTGDLTLGQSGVHSWRIPAAGPSTLSVGANADLGGTLQLEFPDGAPSVGATWNLIDSATVDVGETPGSGFDNIDQSRVGVGLGQTFVVQTVAGGVHGQQTQLELEQHPVLVVDRATGATSIQNFGSGATVDFDTYTIGSAQGSLKQANWSSIAPLGGWVEANPSSHALSELNTISSESIAGGASIALGTPVELPAPTVFGQETEDITFRFAKPDESVFSEGKVIYTGVPNSTLTLNVDPETGAAQIINGTAFTVSIDVYNVSSATDSLESADGSWDSLEDQGASGGNWFEANVSDERISELLTTGGLELAPNAMVPIGMPFDTVGGIEDLVFQFAVVEDSQGDFDQDGDVDGRDFLEWQLGNSPDPLSASDLAVWQSHFGNQQISAENEMLTGKVLYSPLVNLGGSSQVSATAVPEPNTVALLLASVSFLFGAGRKSIVPVC